MLLGSALVGLLKPCGADTHRDQRGVAPCRCSVCPAGLRRWRRRAAASAIQRAHVKSIKAPAAAAGHVLLSAPPGDVHAMANLHNVETFFDSVNRAAVCAAVQVSQSAAAADVSSKGTWRSQTICTPPAAPPLSRASSHNSPCVRTIRWACCCSLSPCRRLWIYRRASERASGASNSATIADNVVIAE